MTACASVQPVRQQVEIQSVPTGAEVWTIQDERLGVTPLLLEGDQLERVITDGSYVRFVLRAPGYYQREVLLEYRGQDRHEIRLTQLEERYFFDRLLGDFQTQGNELARQVAEIQGLIIGNKLDEAERALNTFQNRYPGIAVGYVFAASVESLRGNSAKARGYLLRARLMDPLDPVVIRLLGQTTMKGAQQP